MLFRASMLLLCVAAVSSGAQSNTSELEGHIEQAQHAQSQQDCLTAAREYTAAVRLLPSSGELRTNQGIALYCSDQFNEAMAALRKALQLKPTLAVPHLFLGLSAFHLSDNLTAIKELKLATQALPEDPTARLWLGYAYSSAHQDTEAVAEFEEVLHLQTQNVDAEYALGQTYFEIGRQKVLELEKVAPKGRGIRQLASAQDKLRGTASSSADHDSSPSWSSPKEEKLYNEALEAEVKARAALQTVLDEEPESDRAHQIQGDAYSLQRDNAAAIAEYEAVLHTNPKLPGVRLALANCFMQTNRFQEALSALIEEQVLEPRSADVWASTGRVQQAMGRDQEALASLQKATTLPGTPPAARLLLGKTLLRLNDAKSALPQLESALAEGADPATTNYLLARAYRATGDRAAMQKALNAYQRDSLDAAERRTAMIVTSDPKALPTGMTSQEVEEANAMTAKHD